MGPTRMTLTKPVIAAVEGHAVAGGLELALWCDLRVAAEDAVFGVFCRRFGVPLCDLGTVRLPRLIGPLPGHGPDPDRSGGRWRPRPSGIGLVNRLTRPGAALEEAVAPGRRAGRPPPGLPAQRPAQRPRAVGPRRGGGGRGRGPAGPCRRRQRRDPGRGSALRRRGGPRRRAGVIAAPGGRRPGHTPRADTVAAFDFDGTLTRGGSVVPFLVSVRGRLAGTRGARGRRHPNSSGRPSSAARRPTAPRRRCSSGCWPVCRRPRSTGSAGQLRPRTPAAAPPARGPGPPRVAPAQGHRVVIVSASPECYVGPAGEELGVDGVLATRLAVDAGGSLTGRYEGANCRGAEKYTRLMAWLRAYGPGGRRRTSPTLWAYGNSRGDLRLLRCRRPRGGRRAARAVRAPPPVPFPGRSRPAPGRRKGPGLTPAATPVTRAWPPPRPRGPRNW